LIANALRNRVINFCAKLKFEIWQNEFVKFGEFCKFDRLTILEIKSYLCRCGASQNRYSSEPLRGMEGDGLFGQLCRFSVASGQSIQNCIRPRCMTRQEQGSGLTQP
jgi:hypothetical protein